MNATGRNVFKDPARQREFEERGYMVLPLFGHDELEILGATFDHYFPETPPAFFSSSYLADFGRKKEISKTIERVMVPKLEVHFRNYRCIGAAFLSKAPDPQSELPMHQDWTIVDESRFLAANIWTPLTQPSEENGTLEVLPGSHKTFRSLRAPTLPFSGEGLQAEIKKHLVPLYVQPGEAVVLDQALVHYSDQNRSSKPRVAFTTGLISKDAPLFFHYWNKERRELEKFAMDDDFLFRWENFHQDIFQRPKFGESLGKKTYDPVLFSRESLLKALGEEPEDSPGPAETVSPIGRFFQRLFSR